MKPQRLFNTILAVIYVNINVRFIKNEPYIKNKSMPACFANHRLYSKCSEPYSSSCDSVLSCSGVSSSSDLLAEALGTVVSMSGNLRVSARNRKVSNLSSLSRHFSTNSEEATTSTVVPVIVYRNADIDKLQITKENKGKSGVYRWVNLVNGKSYVGSSVDLGRRMGHYFSLAYLERYVKKGKSQIYASLLKYGYSSFSLEILEYCEKSLAVSREQYYIDLLNSEYNILKKAGSPLGYKHSDETIERLRAFAVRPDNLEKLKIFNASLAQKERMRINTSSEEHKKHLKRIQLASSHSVIVLDTFNNETTVLPSIHEAARFMGTAFDNVRVAIKGIKGTGDFSRLIKKQYKVKPCDDKS